MEAERGGALVLQAAEQKVKSAEGEFAERHAEVVRALHALGADLNRARKGGTTPTFVAAYAGHAGAVRALHALGADVNQAMTDDHKATPLIIAAYLGRSQVVQLVLSANPDRTYRSPPGDGRTAAQWCEKGVRAPHWDFLDSNVNEEGRAACRALF